MSFRAREWQGVVFVTIALVATVWLAASGKLNLYIHPRYIVFTVVMALIGIVFVLGAIAVGLRGSKEEHHDDHPHDHDGIDPENGEGGREVVSRFRRSRRTLAVLGGGLAVLLAIGLLILPPATLSSATAGQRAINSSAVSSQTTPVADATGASSAAFQKFSVLDWASILRQSSDPALYDGKPAHVIGFITEDPDDPTNMFYVSRFVITCCAVDAQPVGVPVYLADWKSSFAIDEWIDVTGGFIGNSSTTSKLPIVLSPDDIREVSTPDDPYLY